MFKLAVHSTVRSSLLVGVVLGLSMLSQEALSDDASFRAGSALSSQATLLADWRSGSAQAELLADWRNEPAQVAPFADWRSGPARAKLLADWRNSPTQAAPFADWRSNPAK